MVSVMPTMSRPDCLAEVTKAPNVIAVDLALDLRRGSGCDVGAQSLFCDADFRRCGRGRFGEALRLHIARPVNRALSPVVTALLT